MEAIRQHLRYSNVVATIALFIALGGASYAAVQLPKSSVGTKQLKSEAVSTKKLKAGAVTSEKLADRSVTGAKVDLGTLGTVPNAASAANANHAVRASRADSSRFADQAGEAGLLDGRSGQSFGSALMAHTQIPATTEDAEWWIPVSGMGEASEELDDVEMLTPATAPLFATGFTVHSRTGPGSSDEAEVYAELYYMGQPIHPGMRLQVRRFSSEWWGPGNPQIKIDGGGGLAIKVTEETNGESIPPISLKSALYLSPVPE